MPPLGEIITALSPVFYFHKCPITYFPSPPDGRGNFCGGQTVAILDQIFYSKGKTADILYLLRQRNLRRKT